MYRNVQKTHGKCIRMDIKFMEHMENGQKTYGQELYIIALILMGATRKRALFMQEASV